MADGETRGQGSLADDTGSMADGATRGQGSMTDGETRGHDSMADGETREYWLTMSASENMSPLGSETWKQLFVALRYMYRIVL